MGTGSWKWSSPVNLFASTCLTPLSLYFRSRVVASFYSCWPSVDILPSGNENHVQRKRLPHWSWGWVYAGPSLGTNSYQLMFCQWQALQGQPPEISWFNNIWKKLQIKSSHPGVSKIPRPRNHSVTRCHKMSQDLESRPRLHPGNGCQDGNPTCQEIGHGLYDNKVS